MNFRWRQLEVHVIFTKLFHPVRYLFAHKVAILSYMKSLSLTKPHMIIMVGIPGSGKTFFAEKFASTFHAPLVCVEKIEPYSPENSLALSQIFLDELLKTQQSIVIDGGTDTRAERMELAKKAKEADYETLYIWVQTDGATAESRALRAKKDSGLTKDEYERRLKRFAPLNTASDKPLVISGKHTYASQAKVVLKRLSTPRAEISSHRTPPAREEPAASTRRNITIR